MFSLKTPHAKRLNARGDTIIEVLLAIAIISTILSGAYIVTNKSLIAGRESQERGNALKLSQGQIERIKTLSATDAATLFNIDGSSVAAKPFCVNDANKFVKSDDVACAVNANGVPSTAQPVYRMSINRLGNSGDALNTFTLTTEWASLKSSSNNSVKLTYKVYP